MTINDQDLLRLAKLSRIEITPEELAGTRNDLNRILGLIADLQAIDTNGIEPMAHPLEAHQDIALRLRPDEAAPTQTTEQRSALMRNAPAQHDGLFLVPTVIE
ncbi:Asp-tRNA(Asn)/Glu-tRNA(Gln) amidotransferase subunit GatC [Paracandidimonas soli]|uniref:Asp-tRNA(Asn)/Glu-tRNA(Gln) amidotransferase subunit GatC n=1 Tax=Paracandidimonas soli TaxID=1917182 RepID=UPI003340882D